MKNCIYVYVTPFFPTPTSWRGAVCYDFVRALNRIQPDLRVEVFCEGNGLDYEIGGISVHTFKAWRLPSNIFPNLLSAWNKRSFLNKVRNVLVSKYNLDPISCYDSVKFCHGNVANYGIYSIALKKKNPSCKSILQHHDLASFGLNMGVFRHNWLYNMIQFPILRRMHEKIDTHVFISEASRKSFLSAPDTSWTHYEDYKKQMRGLPYRPVKINDSIILHNGVDKSIFCSSTSQTSRTSRTSQTFTIGCVGNFSELKDQLGLIKALEILNTSVDLKSRPRPNIHVKFVGSGETLEECKRLAREQEEQFRATPTPITYTFLSEVPHEQLADFYRSLDLFVLPSTFEGFGCVYTEAHSCGVPFIACEGQGIDDIIYDNERRLWLCPPKDVEGLAMRIERCIEDWRRGNLKPQPLAEDQSIDSIVRAFVAKVVKE